MVDLVQSTSRYLPDPTPEHIEARIEYAINQIDFENNCYKSMLQEVHIDEKWFYITRVNKKVILVHGKEPDKRHGHSKSNRTKIMFLTAVARPRWDYGQNQWFDGNLGIWPIIKHVPSKRTSRNRPKGTMEIKNLSCKRPVYTKFICEKVLTAIRRKFQVVDRNKVIFLQQDNASAHIGVIQEDPIFRAARARNGLNIEIKLQVAQSPDTNVLDLGYFQAIEAIQQKKRSRTVEELIDNVQESFKALHRKTLEKVFLSHQAVCAQIILHDGSNEYRMPHVHKETLRENGLLPLSIPLTNVVIDCANYLRPHMCVVDAPMEEAPPAEDPTTGMFAI